MLNPNSRCLYTSALTPPPGMIFDEAVATTFSMDPAVLLEASVYLALMAADGQTDPDPLSVLEAIRRYSKRITVYVQRGRIQVPNIAKPNPLFGYLEEMVVEVIAPNGGVFHPKIWAIRFVSPDQSNAMYRLVVLTRNMTTDQSWDLSLQLEGTITGRKSKRNKPLAHLFRMLPDLATGLMAIGRAEQAVRFAEALHRVDWDLPDGFDELDFYLPGIKEFDWEHPVANKMAVISPFCSDRILQKLGEQSKSTNILISRPESLAALSKDTLALFTQCLHLDEAAETEDGEDDNAVERQLSTGLHAKVYLFETRHYSDYTHVVIGSANATNAALNVSKNIEILVGLVGKKNKIGGIDELLGEDGLGEYLVEFDTNKGPVIDTTRSDAEDCVEQARSLLSEAMLSIECSTGANESLWALAMRGNIPTLAGIKSASAWPITVNRDLSVKIVDTDSVSLIKLGDFSASSVTGLIAFELKSNHPDVAARFVLNLPITGIPAERDVAILRTVISNQDGFIRYLLLLLGDNTESGTEPGDGGRGNWQAQLATGEDIPLLEDLTHSYSRHPERLSEISRLVRDLSKGNQHGIIPEDFLKLWSVFEEAIEKRDA